jgi:hypothetical protein
LKAGCDVANSWGSRHLTIVHSISDLTEEMLLQQDAALRKVTCAG